MNLEHLSDAEINEQFDIWIKPGSFFEINEKGKFKESIRSNGVEFFLIIERTDTIVTIIDDRGEMKTVSIMNDIRWRRSFLDVITHDWKLVSKSW